jgi:hypothetical protein
MALSIRKKKLPIDVALMDMSNDIVGDGAEGCQFFGVFIINFKPEFLFQRHQCFEYVQGVEAEVIRKRGFTDEGGFIYAQFFMKYSPYPCRDLGLINNSIHNQSFEKQLC